MHFIVSFILPMDIYHTAVLNYLKSIGYTHTSSYALSMLTSIFKATIHKFLKTLVSVTTHAQRSKTTIVDLHSLLRFFDIRLHKVLRIHPYMQLNLDTEQNMIQDCAAFENSIVSKIDRYIHIYEFMPSFPPTHTFKKTFPKETKSNETPEKIKIKLEQVGRAEKNLIRMMRMSNKLPKRVNFMDQMK